MVSPEAVSNPVGTRSASVTAVLNCASVPVMPTIEVWSPVLVPLEVPEKVPLWVASVPRPEMSVFGMVATTEKTLVDVSLT